MLLKTGILNVENNEVFVADPCYFGGTPYMIEKVNLPNGIYNTYVEKSTRGDSKGRIMELFIVVNYIQDLDYLLEDIQGVLGVDSGQMGIFTHEETKVSLQDLQDSLNKEFPYEDWKRNFTDTDTETDKFYKVWCNHTLSQDHLSYDPVVAQFSRFSACLPQSSFRHNCSSTHSSIHLFIHSSVRSSSYYISVHLSMN